MAKVDQTNEEQQKKLHVLLQERLYSVNVSVRQRETCTHTLTSRDGINTKITTSLDQATDKWELKKLLGDK